MNKKVKKEVVREATEKSLPFIRTSMEMKQGMPAYVYVYEYDEDDEIPFVSPIMDDPIFAAILAKEVSKRVKGEIRKTIGVYKLVKVG